MVKRIWTQEEAFGGPAGELAPDLTLSLRDGGHVSVLRSDEPLKSRSEIKGSHRREGVFIAKGPAIRRGERLSELSILDVPPLLLYSLGLAIPEDFEGRLPTDAIEPSFLEERPAASGAAGEAKADEKQKEGSLSAEDEAIMAERLRALGYIE